MAYPTVTQVRAYALGLKTAQMNDTDLLSYATKFENRILNPILKKQYDITSIEVTNSETVKDISALGGAVLALKSYFGANSGRNEMKPDIDMLQADLDRELRELTLGIKRL